MPSDDTKTPSTLGRDEGQKTLLREGEPLLAGAEGDRAHCIVVVQGPDAGLRFQVGSEPLTIGRAERCDVSLRDPLVSKFHCRLTVDADGVLWITDEQSTNGTYLDGERLTRPTVWGEDAVLHAGEHAFRHEYRSRREIEASQQLSEDLRRAAGYVRSLLPAMGRYGSVTAEWCYVPSALLGGDTFGYHALDEHRFAVYLLDVCGHGVHAAMHSVSVMHMLRHQSLPVTDFTDPVSVLEQLNRQFQMEAGGMYFTLWYGVYDQPRGELSYASAGHPPALLRLPDGTPPQELRTPNPPVGVLPAPPYRAASAAVPPGSRLYMFSDGVFEVETAGGGQIGLSGMSDMVAGTTGPRRQEATRILLGVQSHALGPVTDDFSLVVLSFD